MIEIDSSGIDVMPIPTRDRNSMLLRIVDDANLEALERTWPKAPSVVHLARTVAITATSLWSLAAALVVGDILALNNQNKPVTIQHFVALTLSLVFAMTNLWLIGALKRGMHRAWLVQRVLAILGLPLAPLGTIAYLLVLQRWQRLETKAWFTTT